MYSPKVIYITLIGLLAFCSSSSAIETTSVNKLTLNFFKSLNDDVKTKQNVLYSPLSLSISLGMLMQGASPLMADEIAKFLGQAEDEVNALAIHENFKDIIDEYKGSEKEFHLKLANVAFVAKEANLKQSFKRKLTDYYRANLVNEDFKSNPAGVVKRVNKYVADETEELIPKAVESINPNTELMLLNTIAFKGRWTKLFYKQKNVELDFHNADGTDSKVTYLTDTRSVKCGEFESESVSVVEIPYRGNASIYVFLPKEKNGLNKLMSTLTDEKIDNYIANLALHFVNLRIPKFSFESKYELRDIFVRAGLPENVVQQPLTNVFESSSLKLSNAIHRTAIVLSEEGTKATAATVLNMVPLSSFVVKNTFIADHPFFMLIRDNSLALNLFAGAVNKL